MSFQRYIISHLKVIHSQFSLFILKAAFNGETREAHPQEFFGRRVGRTVGHKILDLLAISRRVGTCHHEKKGSSGNTVVADVEGAHLGLPDNGAFLAVLDVKAYPWLVLEKRGVTHQFIHSAGGGGGAFKFTP